MSELVAPKAVSSHARPSWARFAAWAPGFNSGFVSRLIILVLAVLTFDTYRDYGVSWDEQVQNIYGHDLLSYYISDFHDQSAFHFLNLKYYGGAFDLLAAILNSFSPLGEYETRHLLGGVIGLIGFIGAWRLGKLLAGERGGLFALMLMALTPLLYGHNFINPKDAPFAWALLWSIYYICRAIGELPKPKRGTAIGLGIALGLAMGTRVVAVIVLLYCAPAFIAYAIGRYRQLGDARATARELGRFLGALWPAIPIVLALTALFWPWVMQSPDNLDIAIELFSHFPWKGEVLFNGHMYHSTNLPWDYLPLLAIYQLPEIALMGVAAALVFCACALVKGGASLLTDKTALCYSVLVSAVAVPLLDFFIGRPEIYNGIRHFLFMIPPLVMLAGLGLERAYRWACSRARLLGHAVGVVLALAAAWQTFVMVRLHPDEYLYFNSLVGGVKGAAGRFDLDYWGLSLAEAAKDLAPKVKKLGVKANGNPWWVYVCGDWLSAAYFFPPEAHMHYTGAQSVADFVIAIREPHCAEEVKGKRVLEVKRGGTVLSYATDLRGLPDYKAQ
jgi:4-amino-4-deoxy-L-arabinose transferase-like glycosyltransferase